MKQRWKWRSLSGTYTTAGTAIFELAILLIIEIGIPTWVMVSDVYPPLKPLAGILSFLSVLVTAIWWVSLQRAG